MLIPGVVVVVVSPAALSVIRCVEGAAGVPHRWRVAFVSIGRTQLAREHKHDIAIMRTVRANRH
jgi:hypothetical protein